MENEIEKVIACFPPVFGLRGFPGARFRLSGEASFYDAGGVLRLYTQRESADGRWSSFASCTAHELCSQVRALA